MRKVRFCAWGLWFFVVIATAGSAARAQSKAEDQAKAPEFEVASIRMIQEKDIVPLTGSPISPPGAGTFTMREVTLNFAIGWAFQVDWKQITGAPDWLGMQCYEISAKPSGDVGLSYDQLRPLLQRLLQERFHLTYHREMQKRKGYALVVAKGGPKLKPSGDEQAYGYIFEDRIRAQKFSLEALAHALQNRLDVPVKDETGLKGTFDFDLSFAPTDGTESSKPSIFTALEEQLGLKLQRATIPVEMFVIDHVERVPIAN